MKFKPIYPKFRFNYQNKKYRRNQNKKEDNKQKNQIKMNIADIINPANLVYEKTKVMNDVPMHNCPGCSHGVVHKIEGEIIE